MTLAAEPILDRNRLLDQQHIVLRDVSWSFYERTLVHRMEQEEQTAVLREFQQWVRTLSKI